MRLDHLVAGLAPIDLPTMEAVAGLMDRVDRKYVVPADVLERLVRDLAASSEDWRVLEIDGRRCFGYTSVYFDDGRLSTYRAHVQRRRRRYKVRVRRYDDSGLCMLEVKRKGRRGRTEKVRRKHPVGLGHLGEDGRQFVAEALDGYLPPPAGDLAPVLVTSNRRSTLARSAGGARVTVDTEVTCGWGDETVALRPGHVLVESKTGHGPSTVDRLLRSYGHRPVRVSKFCVGVAGLLPDLPSNPWRRTMRQFFEVTGPEE